jgi:hypothetical protein
MTIPREEFQFDWCYRVQDPQDMIDDYGDDSVLGDNPIYHTPENASLTWKQINPVPAPTITFHKLEQNIQELSDMLEEKQLRYSDGQLVEPWEEESHVEDP